MLGDSLPSVAPNNVSNVFSANAVFDGKHFLSDVIIGIPAANFRDLRFGKLCRSAAAVLVRFVLHIVGMSADPKMGWIHAGGIVARMANARPIGDGAVLQLVTEAMSKNHFFVDSDNTVTIGHPVASPFPTVFGFINFCPKTKNGRVRAAMTVQEAQRFTLDPSGSLVRLGCNVGRLTAAALAEMNRRFVRGMIAHVDTFLSRFGHAAGRFQRRCGASIGISNYSANGRFSQAGEV